MLYNYDEMIKKYPPYYVGAWRDGVIEVIEVLSIKDSFLDKTFPTAIEAENKIREMVVHNNSSLLDTYDKYFKEWDDKNIFEKALGYKKHKKVLLNYNNYLENIEKLKKSEVVFKFIDKDRKYLFPIGLLNNGDTIYTHVIQDNRIAIGFYEAKIKDIEYVSDLNKNDNIESFYPRGTYRYTDRNNQTIEIGFASDVSNGLYTSFFNHEIGLNKELELEKYQNYITKQISFYESEIGRNKEDLKQIKMK